MTFRFFHDPKAGDEWYTVERMATGLYKAVCTRETEIYKLGEVNYFNFFNKQIFKAGKLRPHNHSLTLINIKTHQRL